MAVVFYHHRTYLEGVRLTDHLFESGASGVDLFFVISGFIMVHTTARADGSPRYALKFFAKRFSRIWPVYIIATLVYVPLVADLRDFDSEAIFTLGKAFAFQPLGADGPPFFWFEPLVVGWTLNYEMWFYLLFALSLLAGRWRWRVLVALFSIFTVVVPLVVVGRVASDANTDLGLRPALLAMAANPIAWEFLAGVAIGLLYRSSFTIRDRDLSRSFVAIAATFVLWQLLSTYHDRHGPQGWGPAMVLLVLAMCLHYKQHTLRAPRPLLWLGDISYSIYLVHCIPLNALPRFLDARLVAGGGFFVASISIGLVLAHWSHRYLERGLAQRMQRWLLREPAQCSGDRVERT